MGNVTDSSGARTAQIVIQAPGYLSYRDNQGQAITFDGSSIQTKASSASNDSLFESLLANFPDSVFLQVATGGGLRRLGSHFRTDNGKTPGYSGLYWTLFAFAPKTRPSLTAGKGLQEQIFIAIDEKTGLMADVRTVLNAGGGQRVTQTQFQNWTQVSGQWYPGTIVRLEDGSQTLTFQTQSASTGPALPPSAFQP